MNLHYARKVRHYFIHCALCADRPTGEAKPECVANADSGQRTFVDTSPRSITRLFLFVLKTKKVVIFSSEILPTRSFIVLVVVASLTTAKVFKYVFVLPLHPFMCA